MLKGTVKWFNPTKGHGFISPKRGYANILVHISEVKKAGLESLSEGQEIWYEEKNNYGKVSAINLKAG